MRLIISEQGGSVGVQIHYPDQIAAEWFGPMTPFVSPMSLADYEDLRFYLEDYLKLPVGPYAARGVAVEQQKLREWGEALYHAVFDGDPTRRDAYLRARARLDEGKPVEVLISSESPRFLALPWEILKAPTDAAPLSLAATSFDRSLPNSTEALGFADAADGFRLLMVIARPQGADDVAYRSIARALFENRKVVGDKVRIEVLRPPTLEAMRTCLEEAYGAGRPFHAVHFDGHGTFGVRDSGPIAFDQGEFFQASAPKGYLCFETEQGNAPDLVSSEDFAAALKAGRTPLVILNACRSGTIAHANDTVGPEATVATRLLQEGIGSVVAMSHAVYVVAAAAFMVAFYERLFAGRTVSQAVADGRRALRREANANRPSLKGEMPLQDWFVPVHYVRRSLSLPGLTAEHRTAALSAERSIEALFHEAAAQAEASAQDPLVPIGGVFFGRDRAFYAMERAVRLKRVCLLHGVAGTGKTELAKAFGRWLRDSGGLDDHRLVFFHSFEPGATTFGIDGVLAEVFGRLGNTDLHRLGDTTAKRAAIVLTVLAQVRALLIWDNFETVMSMPLDGSEPAAPLDAQRRAELSDFVARLKDTRSSLIITSRSPEPWLGGADDLVRLPISGLREDERLDYADYLLGPHTAAQKNRAAEPEAFRDLLEFLQGNPLSMRLVLPHLDTEPVTEILAALRSGADDTPGFEGREGRLASLGASLLYSMRHLSPDDRKRLSVLVLLDQIASACILGTMPAVNPDSDFALDIRAWDALLKRCGDIGLVSGIGLALYRIHPALPAYLTADWRRAVGEGFEARRDATLRDVIACAARYCDFLAREFRGADIKGALAVTGYLRAGLCTLLGAALQFGEFNCAHAILLPLKQYWQIAAQFREQRIWYDRVRAATETADGQAPPPGTAAGELWFYVVNAEAHRAFDIGDLETAEHFQQQVRATYEGQDDPKGRNRLAHAQHELGLIAMQRRDLDAADAWFQTSGVLLEALDDRANLATSHYHRGIVAFDLGRLDVAETWYRKALGLYEELKLLPELATCYHELGMIAKVEQRFPEAEELYTKALMIKEQLRNYPSLPYTYIQLSDLETTRGNFDLAEKWARKALEIAERYDLRPHLAGSCHQLGLIAFARGDLASTKSWITRSLAIKEGLTNRLTVSKGLCILSQIAESEGETDAAFDLAVQACHVFGLSPNNVAIPVIVGLTREHGEKALVQSWTRVTTTPPPDGFLAAVRRMVAE